MFEKDYIDNYYQGYSYENKEDYNLEIREDGNFDNSYFNCFNHGYMTNDEFLENFMKIDYNYEIGIPNKICDVTSTNSSFNKNLNNSQSLENQVNSTADNNSEKNKVIAIEEKLENPLLTKKKGRPMTDNKIIFDEVNNKVYYPNEDDIEYKKARKRLQNRESAVKSRQKKKETSKIIESEKEYLRMENYRLYHENKNLNNEKKFLIEQIKFMQNLIKSNNIVPKQNTIRIDSIDIEKNISIQQSPNSNLSGSSSTITYNGSRQKSFGKIFSIFIICIISISYVSFEPSDFNTGDKIVFNSGSTMSLNDASERQKEIIITPFYYTNVFKICLLLLIAYISWNFTSFIENFNYYKNIIFKHSYKLNKNL